MPDFVYLIHPLRHEFFASPTELEAAMMDAHDEYLKKGTHEQVVLLAGLSLDETFGMVVFSAPSEAQARLFMLDDPLVKSNVMIAELHPLKISILKGK